LLKKKGGASRSYITGGKLEEKKKYISENREGFGHTMKIKKKAKNKGILRVRDKIMLYEMEKGKAVIGRNKTANRTRRRGKEK